MHLDVADRAVGAPVAELEVRALRLVGGFEFGLQCSGRQGIDLADVHARQRVPGPSVELLRGVVRIDDATASRVEDQHHRMAVREDRAVVRLAAARGALGALGACGRLLGLQFADVGQQ